MTETPRFGIGSVTRFYVPLLLQAFSQSLTYPLVAGIVTHGEFGINGLTAFSQGLMIMFMIGAIGGGLVTTGMVFAKTWRGYTAFKRLNAMMMISRSVWPLFFTACCSSVVYLASKLSRNFISTERGLSPT